MQAELHAQHAAVHDQHQERLWSLTQELQEQERRAVAQLKVEQDARLTALRMELQVCVCVRQAGRQAGNLTVCKQLELTRVEHPTSCGWQHYDTPLCCRWHGTRALCNSSSAEYSAHPQGLL